MDKNNLSIATITWARDANEEELLRASLQELSKLEIPVFVTDGGSDKSFLNFVQNLPNFVLLLANAKGVWAQAKNSLTAAYRAASDFILYTEPDKLSFFKKGLPRMLDEVNADEQSGIITASRSAKGFATFPAFQQMTETAINNCCKEVIGNEIDYTYGPFIVNHQLIPYFNLIEEDIGWGWRPFIFGVAHRLAYKVKAFTDDFECPANQQKDNDHERLYRIRQLSQNIQGIVLAATVSIN